MSFRKVNASEEQLILNWINDKYYFNFESVSELLHDTDEDELSEIMYECAFGINRLLHYDNNNIYIEDIEIL